MLLKDLHQNYFHMIYLKIDLLPVLFSINFKANDPTIQYNPLLVVQTNWSIRSIDTDSIPLLMNRFGDSLSLNKEIMHRKEILQNVNKLVNHFTFIWCNGSIGGSMDGARGTRPSRSKFFPFHVVFAPPPPPR